MDELNIAVEIIAPYAPWQHGWIVWLGVDDIIRTISTYFVVFSEIPNGKCTRNRSEMYL
jgi:hypothetical protein